MAMLRPYASGDEDGVVNSDQIRGAGVRGHTETGRRPCVFVFTPVRDQSSGTGLLPVSDSSQSHGPPAAGTDLSYANPL